MKINRKSWHYQLMYFGLMEYSEIPRNLCDYFKAMLSGIIKSITIAVLILSCLIYTTMLLITLWEFIFYGESYIFTKYFLAEHPQNITEMLLVLLYTVMSFFIVILVLVCICLIIRAKYISLTDKICFKIEYTD